MMESAQVALLVLGGVLIGLLIPVLLSARAALKQATALLKHVDEKLGKVLDEAHATLERTEKVAAELEAGAPAARRFFTTLDETTRSLKKVQSLASTAGAIGAAVGPAVAAAVRSLSASAPVASTASEPPVPDKREEENPDE